MNIQICPKCNTVISNDFDNTLAFCTHCGAGINFGQTDKTLALRRDGSATKIEKKDYDDGKTTDEINEQKAVITNEQFERLASSLVENDFFNQTDSTERISEGDNSLKVKFSGKEKEIKTSNIGKDTPQIEKIINDFKTLEATLNWSPAK